MYSLEVICSSKDLVYQNMQFFIGFIFLYIRSNYTKLYIHVCVHLCSSKQLPNSLSQQSPRLVMFTFSITKVAPRSTCHQAGPALSSPEGCAQLPDINIGSWFPSMAKLAVSFICVLVPWVAVFMYATLPREVDQDVVMIWKSFPDHMYL